MKAFRIILFVLIGIGAIVLLTQYVWTPKPNATPSIVGKELVWQYTQFLDGSKKVAPEGKFVLMLNSDNTLSSRTDCNTLMGKYIIDGEVLSFGQFVSTKMACQGSIEGEYAQELARVTSYTVTANTLTFNLIKDSGTMIFTWKK